MCDPEKKLPPDVVSAVLCACLCPQHRDFSASSCQLSTIPFAGRQPDMSLFSFPPELICEVLVHATALRDLKGALRLRLVNSEPAFKIIVTHTDCNRTLFIRSAAGNI